MIDTKHKFVSPHERSNFQIEAIAFIRTAQAKIKDKKLERYHYIYFQYKFCQLLLLYANLFII